MKEPAGIADVASLPTIFVAEDDPVMTHLLTLNLSRAGFALRTSADGRRVIEDLKGGPADLVLLDYGLPGRSGLEILRDFQSDPQLASLPVIVVTGHAREEVQRELRMAGAREVFTKPFSPSALIDAIRETLS